MAKRFLTPIRILNLASDPGSASDGDIYYNTAVDKLKLYANSAWTEVGGGAGGALVEVSDTAPVSPDQGALWYNSSSGKTFIYYADANSSQWVEIGAATISPTGNYDGGLSNSNYGGVTGLDGGGAS